MAFIRLNNLEILHNSMINRGVENQMFDIRSGAITFCCIFSIGGQGDNFQLSLTSRNDEPEFFLFHVTNNFEISNSFDDYRRLGSLLNTGERTFNPLNPTDFLNNINAQVPQDANIKNVPTNQDIVEYRHDIEERNKPYFSHWRHHGNRANVSRENRLKTLRILGAKALEYSNNHNASSCWTAENINVDGINNIFSIC